jgi:hypothetical protein
MDKSSELKPGGWANPLMDCSNMKTAISHFPVLIVSNFIQNNP